jgi:hypothetical protein
MNRLEQQAGDKQLGEQIADAISGLQRRIKRGDPIPVTEVRVHECGCVEVQEKTVIFGNRG